MRRYTGGAVTDVSENNRIGFVDVVGRCRLTL
jgi:hypothetical protein